MDTQKAKEEYFRQLFLLNEISDDEDTYDGDDLREILQKNRTQRPPSSTSTSFASSSRRISERRRPQSRNQTTTPLIHRTTSAPVSAVSVIKETPLLRHRSSLLRRITTPSETLFTDTSVIKETPTDKTRSERSIATPNIGSVVMQNSTGIASMLNKKAAVNKKRKRRSKEIKLVPEAERIFASWTVFYIPNDDIAPLRRSRIEKALEYGATWTTEWTSSITHVVVEKKFTYKEVMTFLSPIIKNDSLPPTITLVNDEYPIDCVLFRSLVDPRQERYTIETPLDVPAPPQVPQVIAPGEMSIRQIKNAKYHSTRGAPETPAQSQLVTHTTSPTGNKISPPSTTSEECQSIEHQTLMKEDARASIGNGDDLDKMIEASLKVKHLPLDDDDEDSSRPSSSDDSEGSVSSEEEMNPRTKKTRRGPGNTGNPNRTAICCMTGGTGNTLDSNPNKQTILILEEMNEYYSRMKDEWRTRAYRQAAGILKKQTKKISTYDEARDLPMIGDRLAKKIEEIALTNRLRRLDNTKLDPADQTLQMFIKIYNVGFEVASRWVQAGFKTLDDLKAYAHLTPKQRIGIEHYDDFNTRIPRSEVTALGDVVKKAVTAIDSRVSVMIMGSYRRGAATSGDIDIMLTLDGTTSSDDLLPFFRTLIAHLTEEGFLVASLAESRSEGGSKWHGACVLPGSSVWRRIDFLLVPSTEIGAALIYFTGDDIFNRSIRLLSSRKGMRLNQRGLFKDIMRGPGRVKLNEGTLVEGADEKKIFEILGVPWRPPEQRIIR